MRLLALALLFTACGSNNVTPDALFTSGTLRFTVDGASQSATAVRGLRRTFDGQVMVVAGDVSADQAIQIVVSDSAADVELAGTYTCPGSGSRLVELVLGTDKKEKATSCTVDITRAGVPGSDHATGTFNGTFASGKSVTDGLFDVTVISTDP